MKVRAGGIGLTWRAAVEDALSNAGTKGNDMEHCGKEACVREKEFCSYELHLSKTEVIEHKTVELGGEEYDVVAVQTYGTCVCVKTS